MLIPYLSINELFLYHTKPKNYYLIKNKKIKYIQLKKVALSLWAYIHVPTHMIWDLTCRPLDG